MLSLETILEKRAKNLILIQSWPKYMHIVDALLVRIRDATWKKAEGGHFPKMSTAPKAMEWKRRAAGNFLWGLNYLFSRNPGV